MKNSKFLRSKNLLKSLEAEELKSLNDKRQERKDNGNIDSVSVFGCFFAPARWANIPRNNCIADARNDRRGGFTLVELVITIAIVIILSVISVPIYRGYVDKAKYSEGYALLGTILSAQKAYYSEYGYFFRSKDSLAENGATNYEPELSIDARGNKYFTLFYAGWNNNKGVNENKTNWLHSVVYKPTELRDNGKTAIKLEYYITGGTTFYEE